MSHHLVKSKRILITGFRGTLGTALLKLVPAIGIDRDELDITDRPAIERYFANNSFDILIHCAAFTDVAGAEKNHDACYKINTLGTENLLQSFKGKKFVYISTDYVFDGERGNYHENDVPNPVNYYALTKLLGEMVVRQYPNTLTIRTSFKKDGPWPYPKAFADQWTTADYASERAPQILHAALLDDLFGTIHIGGERKTIYDLARMQTPEVGEMSLHEVPTALPKDVSLDSSKWQALVKKTTQSHPKQPVKQ